MKLNNKGAAISGIIYSILLLFILLLFGVLALLGSRKVVLDKLKYQILLELNSGDDFYRNIKMDKSGASAPILFDNMIPIIYDYDNNVWIKADNTNEYVQNWYDYDNKKWANAVTVSEEKRQYYLDAAVGTEVKEADILTYLVWIPRYKYMIFNDATNIELGTLTPSSIQTIDIVFESNTTPKSNGTIKGEYLTHPAFTFGDKELSGFWVGKFETTGTTTTPTVKPNITSLRNINVSTMFSTAQKFKTNIYGLINTDPHMMKNMEWGAVAYLSHSIYGINDDIRYNNSNTYITGCAATNVPATGYITPGYAGCENPYNTEIGYLASTTGNITGIYDMAGGSWEYVMGVTEDSPGSKVPTSGRNALYNSGFNGKYTCPTCDSQTDTSLTTGIKFPDSKYYDLYEYGTTYNNIEAYSRGKLGDATKELGNFALGLIDSDGSNRYVSSWYNDYSHFIYKNYPWFERGGYWAHGAGAGIFMYYYNSISSDTHSFRLVVSE